MSPRVLATALSSTLALTPALSLAQRPVAPSSAAYVVGPRPTFRWIGGDANATVELGRERDFPRPAVTLQGASNAATAREDLARGTWFWRVRGPAGTSPLWSFTVVGRAARASHWGFSVDTNGDGRAEVLTLDSRGAARRFTTGPGGDGLSLPRGVRALRVEALGDVNGDGFVDVALLGAVGATVFLGGDDRQLPAPGFVIPPAARATLTAVGDADLDGYADLAFATPTPAGARITLLRGGEQRFTAAVVGVVPARTPADNRLPIHLAAGGDTDGDGRPELLVTRRNDESPGADVSVAVVALDPARVATPRSVLRADPRTENATASFGANTLGAVDVNGDGFGDVVVGSAACFSVYLGRAEGPAPTATSAHCASLDAGTETRFSGLYLAVANDLNGDGFGDVLSGEGPSGADSSGRVTVFLGSARGLQPATTRLGYEDSIWSGRGFGGVLWSPGDVNGDGLCDVAVQASGYNPVGQYTPNDTGLFFYPGAAQGPAESAAWWLSRY